MEQADWNHEFRIALLFDWSHRLAHTGHLAAAANAWHTIAMARWAHCKAVGYDVLQTRILNYRWVSHVGHFDLLGAYVKLFRLGLLKAKNICLVIDEDEKIANPALLELFKEHVTVRVVSKSPFTDPFTSLCFWLREDLDYIRLDDDKCMDIDSAKVLADELWQAAGHAPLIRTTSEIDEAGRDFLERHGVSQDDWFVCLHARTPGYHKDRSMRDCRISDYEPLIERLISWGAKVVRMGDCSMEPAKPVEGLIDYAVMPDKDPRVDAYLFSHCRFFIGCASGPIEVARMFNIPAISLNYAPIHRPGYKNLYFLPKLYRWKATGRPLSIRDLTNLHIPSTEKPFDLLKMGIEIVDNSPEELTEAVQYFFEHVVQGQSIPDEDLAVQSAYEVACTRAGIPGTGSIVPRFAHEHPELWLETSSLGEDPLLAWQRAQAARMDAKVYEGELAFAQGDEASAEGIFLSVLGDRPDHARALNDLAIVYRERDKLQEALYCLERAHMVAPQDREVVCNFGALLEEIGELDSAVAVYKGYLASHEDLEIARFLERLENLMFLNPRPLSRVAACT